MNIALPASVKMAIQQLNNAGYDAYVVGGCVRDSLLGHCPEDWDITTSATPEQMQAVFADQRTIETGLKHGTLTVVCEGMPLEITTYRIDGAYSDGRHPDAVTFSRSLSEDLKRRDFTINAMAYHPQSGLVDLYGGCDDLFDGMIRCVGDPHMRFAEDALRILRALRFASVLSFRIHKETEMALRELAPTLSCVSAERINQEFTKLLCGQSVGRILCDFSDVLSAWMPEICHNIDYRLFSAVPDTRAARWAALLWEKTISLDTAENLLRRLRMDNRTLREVITLLLCRDMPTDTDGAVLRLFNRLDSDELIRDYLALCRADDELLERVDTLLTQKRCYKLTMLAVDGGDLLSIGVVNGPEIGDLLNRLLQAVMDGQCVNQKEALLAYAMKWRKPAQ